MSQELYVYLSLFLGIPIMPETLQLQSNGNKVQLSWKEPQGFFTTIAIESCMNDYDCQLHPVTVNETSVELDVGAATFRLIVYQHGQEVARSQPFQETFVLDSKSTISYKDKTNI